MTEYSRKAARDGMAQACYEAGLIQSNHLNMPRLQRGGRPSKSGGIFGAESQIRTGHIDKHGNHKEWPAEAPVRARNRGPVGRKGGVEGSNGNGDPRNWYSAGPGRRHG